MKTSHLSIHGISKGKLLAAVLPIGLAFASPAAFAVDAAAGQASAATTLVSIVESDFQELRRVPFNLTQESRCVAVASAMVVNPGIGDDNRYIFGLVLDGGVGGGQLVPAGATRHIVDFDNKPGEQTDIETVSSTNVFTVPPGAHQILWVAAKDEAADQNVRVTASQLSVMCFDTPLR